MTVFGLVDAAPELFELRRVGGGTYGAARDVLARYVDRSFSYIDAVIFTIVDADRSINRFSLVKLPLPLGEGGGEGCRWPGFRQLSIQARRGDQCSIVRMPAAWRVATIHARGRCNRGGTLLLPHTTAVAVCASASP